MFVDTQSQKVSRKKDIAGKHGQGRCYLKIVLQTHQYLQYVSFNQF